MTRVRKPRSGVGAGAADDRHPVPAPPQVPRYHSLDRLRAVMMFLGLVFHTSVTYLPDLPEDVPWPYQDARTSPFFDWLMDFIHVFRMPVFFTVAGFFAVYLIETRGTREFLRHRFSRIGVPLVAGWFAVAPLMAGAVLYARQFSAKPVEVLPADGLPEDVLMHLWFLYHLLFFCLCAALLTPLLRRIPERLRTRSLDAFGRSVHRYGLAVLVIASALVLYRMKSWSIDFAGGLLPPVRVLATYGLFFLFGALLFKRRDVLDTFQRPAWGYCIAGFACFLVYRRFVEAGCGGERFCDPAATDMHVGATVFLAPTICFLIYGLLGLFRRYLDKPNDYWRYLADASYWMYIVHPPLVMTLPTLLADWPVPAGVKFSLVLGAATALTLVTYHYLVRSTFVGARLNGRRHPRTAPWRARGAGSAA